MHDARAGSASTARTAPAYRPVVVRAMRAGDNTRGRPTPKHMRRSISSGDSPTSGAAPECPIFLAAESPELLLPCYSNQWTGLFSAELGGRLISPEQDLWIRADRLDSRYRSFNPKVPGSRPGRPTINRQVKPMKVVFRLALILPDCY